MSESGRREGSVATSLAELVQLEDDRLARGRAEAEEKVRAASRARAEAEAQARAAEEARVAAELAAQADKERIAREEAARLAALQQATLEETRQRLRLEESKVEHERRVQLLAAQAPAPTPSGSGAFGIGAGGLVGALAAVGVCALVYLGALAPAAARGQAEALARIDEKRAEATAASARADQAESRVRDAERALAQARVDQERMRARIEVLEKARGPQPLVPAVTAPTPGRPPKVDPHCQNPGDPLCSQITGR